MAYLNTIGVKASAVGNHEFDKGFTTILGAVKQNENFPTLGANVYKAGTTTPALQEYSIQTVNGVRVGIVGAVTADTPNIVMPDNVKDVSFGDPVAAVNRVATHLKQAGLADVVVAEYHTGGGLSAPATLAENQASIAEFNDVVTKTTPAVDVLFTAHSHQTYTYAAPTADGTRPLIQSASFGKMLGEVQLGLDPTTKKVIAYSQQNLPTKGVDLTTCADNTTVTQAKAIIDSAKADAAKTGNVVIGSQTGDLTRSEGESALGNLDAQVWLDEMNLPGRPGADIGIMNPGGVRAELPYKSSGAEKNGEITYGEAFAVNPFNNTMQVITLTGAQLKTLLEQQWTNKSGEQVKPLLGLSKNVRYTYDPTKPVNEHITSITVNGKAVTADDSFRITSGSFIIGGGDGYTVLKSGTKKVDTGLSDGDVFVHWIKTHSPITPDTSARGTVGSGASTTPTTPSGTDTSSPSSTPTSSSSGTSAPSSTSGSSAPSSSAGSTTAPATPTGAPTAPTSSTTSPAGPSSSTGTASSSASSAPAGPTGSASTSTGGAVVPSGTSSPSGHASTGPKVDTDQVSSGSPLNAIPVAIGGLLAGAGALVARRRFSAKR